MPGTWQSGSEHTLPTADSSVPFLVPQNLQASELLEAGLPTQTFVVSEQGTHKTHKTPGNALPVVFILITYWYGHRQCYSTFAHCSVTCVLSELHHGLHSL